MTFVERAALETLAVALFESFLRQQANEGRGKTVQDWIDLRPDVREEWRTLADKMIAEQGTTT